LINVGLVGVGKMGVSHFAILGAHRDVHVRAVCDSATYITSPLRKHAKVETFKDYREMIAQAGVDCVVIATPTSTHFEAAKYALERNLHVFVEKPLCLRSEQSRELAELAARRQRVNQVGYHNRFLGTFIEAARLVKSGALGEIYHISGTAFGPVVTRKKSQSTWRSKTSEGGGCLHDYCCHVVDLMNFLVGPPEKVLGAKLQRIYSDSVEDAVYATLSYSSGASGQIVTDWSDASYRKMSTTITVCGTLGKLVVDRQELKVYLRDGHSQPGYDTGWTIRYITELQPPVWYYLRGEEYSSQLDAFVQAVKTGTEVSENSFQSAYDTDRVIESILEAGRS
jgi:scyllo-inositol 2-dehydrogenase (NADP+)